MQTLEAIVDSKGRVRLLGEVRLPKDRRALVTILDEDPKMGNEAEADKNKELIAAFKKATELDIFRDIEDPVEWQRKLRDEWE